MFSGRGFNIDSLNVAPMHDPSTSRITVVLKGDDPRSDMVIKQLRKLVNVVDVLDFKEGQAGRPRARAVKVKADNRTRPELLQIKDIFRAKIVHLSADAIIIEATGDDERSPRCSACSSRSASSISPAPVASRFGAEQSPTYF